MSIEKLLHEEICSEFERLKREDVGTEQYKTTVDGLTKLIDRAIEIDKFNIASEEKVIDREIEAELKREEMESEKKDRLIKNSIAIGSVLIPVGVTIWGALKSWEFEKEGTVTSTMGRMFMNCIRLKK